MNAERRANASIGGYVRRATDQLGGGARLDAEVLIAHALGVGRGWLYAHGDEPLTSAQRRVCGECIARREAGEPVAYITGRREFWSLPLEVTPDVLIPRPETEILVQLAMQHIPPARAARIADLGTGSGCLALALAHERPRAAVVGTDVSRRALAVARGNAERLQLTRVAFRHGRWLEAVGAGTFDAIVCNPPYVADTDSHLQQGDVRFEPAGALAAGPDGLQAIRTLAPQARRHLKPDGVFIMEHGCEQARAVHECLREAGFAAITQYRDLAGRDRAVVAGAGKPRSGRP